MLMHALFALADPRVEQIHTSFVTTFVDMLHHVQEDWDILVSSIRDGTIPDIEYIDHVRDHLQVSCYCVIAMYQLAAEFDDSRITCMQIHNEQTSFGR